MSMRGALDRFALQLVGPSPEDRAAGLDIAKASRDFTHRTRAVVDDKLTFSATLMRAGEVEAANRLLAEVERDVLTEEAALFEKVNEVKMTRNLDRKPYSRLRLARALAVAMIGSTLLASSAVGMAVVGLFREDRGMEVAPGSDNAGDESKLTALIDTAPAAAFKRIAGVRVPVMHLDRLRAMTRGGASEERLEDFLLTFLPPSAAEQVQAFLAMANEELPEPVAAQIEDLSVRANKERAKATGDENANNEPRDEPSPREDQSSGSSNSKNSGNGDEEGDSGGGLPLIGDDDQG